MYKYGAHGSILSAIHSQNLIVHSIIWNGDTCNHLDGEAMIFCGHGCITETLKGSNLKLAVTASKGLGFRLYLGSKSQHKERPNKGFKLFKVAV